MKRRRDSQRGHEAARARCEANRRATRRHRLLRWFTRQANDDARRAHTQQRVARQLRAEIEAVKAPRVLSFLLAPNETAHFFSDVEQRCARERNVYLDFSDTLELTPEAVAVLVSRATEQKYNHGMLVFNNLPPVGPAREVFEHSGALDYLRSIERAGEPDGRGEIVRRRVGKTKKTRSGTGTDRRPTNELTQAAFDRVRGTPYQFDGVQSIFGELLDNTAEHAAPEANRFERWHASAYADRERQVVSFTFLDNGQGIFESLERKGLLDHFARLFTTGRADLLRRLLDRSAAQGFRQYQSRTGKPYRGRGLPRLKKALDRNQISALTLVTNNVIARVAEDDFQLLETDFDGTLVYWEHHGTPPASGSEGFSTERP